MRRLLTLSVLAVALAGMFTVAPSIVTPDKAPQAAAHGWYDTPNGCSGPTKSTNWMVPDSGYGFNFHDECDQHDLCYVQRWYGQHEPGRAACDTMFYNLMARDCARWPWWLTSYRAACTLQAEVYFHGVRQFGSPFFWSPDLASRADTRMA